MVVVEAAEAVYSSYALVRHPTVPAVLAKKAQFGLSGLAPYAERHHSLQLMSEHKTWNTLI